MELAYQPTFRFKLIKKITDKNGLHPVKLRLTYLRKNYDRSTGVSASETEWDEKSMRLTGKGKADQNLILHVIEDKCRAISRTYRINEKEVRPTSLLDEILGENIDSSLDNRVYKFFDEIIGEQKLAGKMKTAEIYKYSSSVLKKFHPNSDLSFNQINFSFLDKFRSFILRTHSVNACSVILRTLRALYNKALAYEKFKEDKYPFKIFSIKSQPTKKRAIKREQMQAIAALEIDLGSQLWHSRNYFLFSYLTQGMNFKDIAELRWDENITDNKIHYRRSKTGDLFVIAINDKINNILDFYRKEFRNEDGFIFKISKGDLTPTQKANRIKKQLSRINKDLKILAEKAKIENAEAITFYVARHTFATSLKKLGYSTSLISDAMGHSDEGTTQIYLDSFDNSVFEEANDRLL